MSVNDDDHEQLEALDTLSLTDFPLIPNDHHRNPPSPATEDLFEFYSGISGGFSEDDHRMSHAEDMFSGGKLIPINDQQPPRKQDQTRDEKHIHRQRCESMHELKSNTSKANASKLVRNSYSLDYKKLNRNSRFIYEPTNNLSNKTSSSRWSDLVFGPLKGPPEMDLRDIRNRQNVNTSKSLFPTVEGSKGSNRFAVSRVGCVHRKNSWGVLGILSCKSSSSVAVNMPLGYEKLSLKN
ncbi:hypothetical protein L1987_70343 [Smallanthus sonchifolius]|uniref:Uncharacterized protein n=1 Tax=Smallanthus sonchifolius TaxID=185202 RepID=A0ACB9ANS1_9ASTR|nr:hypothetical protein L1987_70343 [Smallanthus sonchifolius]